MKLVIFGLTISSSWGNGHATLWRGLCRALAARGHRVVFFEHDVPYYRIHRDLFEAPWVDLRLYDSWDDVRAQALEALRDCDCGMVTSFCPDAPEATGAVLDGPGLKVFYDLDTPVTLAALREGARVPYVGNGLSGFDLVLSYTGGAALDLLKTHLGAPRVAPLYGHVDPQVHRPVPPISDWTNDLSYLGTYAEDRQSALVRWLVEPARRIPDRRFLIGGAQYPGDFPWTENICFAWHVAPGDHPAFYSSSRMTLNITRQVMADMGFCPSGRLFEAAACGTPILSDGWAGLDHFFAPGEEILILKTTDDVLHALELSEAELHRLSDAARERTLGHHTSAHRAEDLERAIQAAFSSTLVAEV